MAARWPKETLDEIPMRLNQTFGDKLADQLPRALWPKLRYAFYPLAVIEVALLLLVLFVPLESISH